MGNPADKVRNAPSKKAARRRKQIDQEWYSLRSMLGYSWALFLFLIGGRERGKSYAVTDFFCQQFLKYGRPFYWLRLTEASAKKLLSNNAEKLIDPDIRRKLGFEIETNGDAVYAIYKEKVKTGRYKKDGSEITRNEIQKRLIARVLALSTFYNDKGSGLFDKDFLNDPNMYYNICLDEMNREKNEKKSFDIVYAFSNQLENLVRSTKTRLRVICIGNTLEEASDILCALDFVPEEFGRYKLKKKRAVIDYIENGEKYNERRAGTVADILSGNSSTFTNKVDTDISLITKKRLIRPDMIVAFEKDKSKWFTIWDGNVVARYNGEKGQVVVPMRPYLDMLFSVEMRDQIISLFDTRSLRFHNLITQKMLKKELELLKPRKG